MKAIKLLILSLLFIGFTNCKDDAPIEKEATEPVVSTFYFIRHGEKDRSNPDNLDPELNQDGLGRAIRWERIFSEVDLDDIYSTDYDRTLMTVAPISVNREMVVQTYSPSTINIDEFKERYLGKNVLVVGHSNTTPDFANKILGEDKYPAMDDYDNSSLYIVRIIDGVATSMQLKMD
ncbi:histidine phosphatase family protein [Cellulophaga baltica]|uniref:histidine phosphatase family protein n=1 Tax=Cellulophaga TaxID=104264 RepID=UPI001C065BD7|nr:MULTISPECIES: phosphoglycerate mutase family protein [Cellulophaga]MBU2996053.1 histidine phosphatase family protein [Cellulophaga baltica]MDO6767448.1 phosphoglycerate mutase family protein [Cellulophaga sp. 1_MG-2023]